MLTLCLLAQWSVAQAPKWVDKAKRAVFLGSDLRPER